MSSFSWLPILLVLVLAIYLIWISIVEGPTTCGLGYNFMILGKWSLTACIWLFCAIVGLGCFWGLVRGDQSTPHKNAPQVGSRIAAEFSGGRTSVILSLYSYRYLQNVIVSFWFDCFI
jgi:hypothetical protein